MLDETLLDEQEVEDTDKDTEEQLEDHECFDELLLEEQQPGEFEELGT